MLKRVILWRDCKEIEMGRCVIIHLYIRIYGVWGVVYGGMAAATQLHPFRRGYYTHTDYHNVLIQVTRVIYTYPHASKVRLRIRMWYLVTPTTYTPASHTTTIVDVMADAFDAWCPVPDPNYKPNYGMVTRDDIAVNNG